MNLKQSTSKEPYKQDETNIQTNGKQYHHVTLRNQSTENLQNICIYAETENKFNNGTIRQSSSTMQPGDRTYRSTSITAIAINPHDYSAQALI